MRRIALAAVLAGGLALASAVTACGSSTSNREAQAAPPGNSRVITACQQLAANWSASDTTMDNSISRQMTGTRAGADFSKMMRAVRNGDAAAASADGKTLSSDCAAVGVTVTFNVTSSTSPTPGPSLASSPSPSPSAAPSPTMMRQTVPTSAPTSAAPTSAPAPAAWCTASASYNSQYNDYDIYVHSNQPNQTATATASNEKSFSYETDDSGYADIYLYADTGNTVTVTVGAASCSTTAG